MRRGQLALCAAGVAIAGCAALLGVEDVEYSVAVADAGAPADERIEGDGGDAAQSFDPELCPDDEPSDAGAGEISATRICGDAGVTVVVDNQEACGECAHRCTPLLCADQQCAAQDVRPNAGGGVTMIGADDDSAYWLTGDRFYRSRWPPDASLPVTSEIYADDAATLRAAFVAPRELWVATTDTLVLVNSADGTARSVHVDPSGIKQIAVDDAYVYYRSNVLKRLSRQDGGQPFPLAVGPVSDIAADGRGQAWTVNAQPAVDGGGAGVGAFVQLRLSDGSLAMPIPVTSPSALALTTSYVYWVDGAVLYRALRVAAPRPIRTGSWPATLSNPGIAVDRTHVYWAPGDSDALRFGKIVRTPRCGGPTRLVAAPNAGVSGPVVGGGYLYWNQVNQSGGVLRTR